MSSTRSINKNIFAEQLIERLNLEFPDQVQLSCKNQGIDLQNLVNSSTSVSSNHRYSTNNSNKTFQIYQIASNISKSIPRNPQSVTPSLTKLYKLLNIPSTPTKPSQRSSVIIEYSSIFTRPSDMIQYNINRARQKFNKSVEIINRIENLKAEEKKRTESVIRKNQERDKKMLEEFNRREVEHGKQTMNVIEYRQKILQKKKENMQRLDKQFLEYGKQLNSRMGKLSEVNKKKLQDLVKKQHEKMRQRIQKDVMKNVQSELETKTRDKEVKESMEELEERISKRLESYENNVNRRVSNARENNYKVEKVFSKSLIDYNKQSDDKLKKVIRKSLVSQQKRSKKLEHYKKYSSTLKESVEKSFMRNSKGLSHTDEKQRQRLKDIESRVNSKTKTFDELKNKFEVAIHEKKQKNSSRFINHSTLYSRALEGQLEFRNKVIDKHIKISNLAEELKTQKFEISQKKRVDNFEIQKIRSSFSSTIRSRSNSRSKFNTVMSNF